MFKLELNQISTNTYFFKGAVNIGYIHQNEEGILIDAGLDKGTAKKVLKALEDHSLPLNHLVITHAHTDHFGGAAYIQEHYPIAVHAPELESAIMKHPVLEPIYLWNGAMPIEELRNKFIEGPSIHIDRYLAEGICEIGKNRVNVVSLPGHSHGQIGIMVDDILFAADSYFGKETLKKHKVPFIVDADETFISLQKISALPIKGAVPGHGEFENDITDTLRANRECHGKVKAYLLERIDDSVDGIDMNELMKEMFAQYALETRGIGQWLLFRTSFTAYITSLVREKKIKISISDYTPILESTNEPVSES